MMDATKDTTTEPYWEDPVYRYVARLHRAAAASCNNDEVVRLDCLMQGLVDGSIQEAVYNQLANEARADRKRQRQERKRHQRPPSKQTDADDTSAVNVADLKRRIFNPSVSRENVIKALEALPAVERKATIAGLPPGLRRKLGEYLKGTTK